MNKHRVSLTTDIWTFVQNMSYMVITAHFIDNDWCLNRRIISFSLVEDHRRKTIGKKDCSLFVGSGDREVICDNC